MEASEVSPGPRMLRGDASGNRREIEGHPTAETETCLDTELSSVECAEGSNSREWKARSYAFSMVTHSEPRSTRLEKLSTVIVPVLLLRPVGTRKSGAMSCFHIRE
jgi:hypothetical protein